MTRVEKRRSLFTKYEFEIGVVTLPIYFSLLIIGVVMLQTSIGQAFTALGLIGTGAATISLINGYKEIKW